ncbi:helix-turn-helix transcriptional regulator [Nocardia brasiliensis]|uniref:helix-turn-helix transcriptional regulator n=1 Tax=Nocardia brasiliensis TaxID=37326 RepID=UPI00366F17DE
MNAVQLSRGIEKMAKPNAFVHPSLRDYLDPTNGPCGSLFAPAFQLEFADYDELAARGDVDGAPIVLPVNTEHQAESLRSIRTTHAMGLIVAVTNDVTGHSTYFAIRSGANFVVNIAIAIERQTEILHAHLLDHMRSVRENRRPPVRDTVTTSDPHSPRRGPTRIRMAPATRQNPPPAQQNSRPALDEFDARLLRMLRTSMTVAEIARLNYLSERSMYRRIRNLYDTLGIASRAELARSEHHADPPPPLVPLRG